MPAGDAYHQTVINALRKDGWQIQADPMHLKWGRRDFFVDLSANKFYLAEKGQHRIAVEVKGFSRDSAMATLEFTLGQFLIYRSVLARIEPQRKLYLAISETDFLNILEEEIGQLIREDYSIPLLIFEENTEVIVAWKD